MALLFTSETGDSVTHPRYMKVTIFFASDKALVACEDTENYHFKAQLSTMAKELYE